MAKTLRASKSNYFEVPNQLTDEFLRDLNGAPLKCYLLLIRKTWGWHKSGDWMSVSQFMGYTGLTKKTIIEALKWLEKNEYIWSVSLGKNGNVQKLYFVMSEETENLKRAVANGVIDEDYLKKMIYLESDQNKYKKSVKRGTFLPD